MRFRFVAVVAVLSFVSSSAPSLARADSPPSGVASAREHYRRATQLYDLQRYLEAAHEYELAYQAKEDPALLFNIGQSYRFAKEWGSALGAYRSFLRNMPSTPNRTQVEAFITEAQHNVDEANRMAAEKAAAAAEQEKLAAEQARIAAERERLRLEEEQRASAQSAVAVPRREPDLVAAKRYRKMKFAGIGVAAGGGLLLIAGGVLLGLAGSTASKYNNATQPTQFVPSDETKVKTFRNAGIGLLAVGGVAAIAGAALAVVASKKERTARFVWSPSVGIGYAGLDVGGAW